jgi:hypothetical protein
VTFGKVPIQAFAKIAAVVDGQEQPLGRDESSGVWNALVKTGILAADGKLQPSFDPTRTGFTLQLPEAYGNAEINVPPQEPIKKSGRNFFAQLATRQAIALCGVPQI